LGSCSQLITAYLVKNLINDSSPKFTWRGTVTDSENRGLSGLTVRVRAEVANDPDPLDFTGLTNDNGQYQIVFKFNDKVSYRLSVLSGTDVLAERLVGNVGASDQRDDFEIQGTAALTVSGIVTDAAGTPLKDVLVIGGSATTEGGAVTPFKG